MTTTAGVEAHFLIGGRYSVPTIDDPSATPLAESDGTAKAAPALPRSEFGIRLSMRPIPLPNGLLRVRVKPRVQTVDFGNSTARAGKFVPAIVTRQINRSIDLKPGQSFAITGILNDEIVQQLKRLPDLENRRLMKSILSARTRRPAGNLLVLVTPQSSRHPHRRTEGAAVTDLRVPTSSTLLDPGKEQLHWPARLVEQADSAGGQVKVVAEETQMAVLCGIVIMNPAERIRVVFAGASRGRNDGVIGAKSPRGVAVVRVSSAQLNTFLGASDEESAAAVEDGKTLEVQLGAIHHGPCLLVTAPWAAEPPSAPLKQIVSTGLLAGESRLELSQIAPIILHSRTYYILGSPESSKYPVEFIAA